MNKMLFDFEQSDNLLTPTIDHGGVNDVNPILTSNNISSIDDQDVYFSSSPSKKLEYVFKTQENPGENHQQQQDDLYSTFDFPVLSEISRTDLQLDGLPFERYISQLSLPSSSSMDVHDPNFYPVDDDSTSSTFLWVGKECTIESKAATDMLVPPSPPLSSTSSSPAESKKGIIRKKNFSNIERKLRKKDQNKSAAEKYRLKKRTERNELLARHADLKNQNRELKFEMENITFQLEQFKHLFVDVLQIPIPSTVAK